MDKMFVDFSCPNCGQRHIKVELDRNISDWSAAVSDVECTCDMVITVLASRQCNYLDVTVKNLDKQSMIYKEEAI